MFIVPGSSAAGRAEWQEARLTPGALAQGSCWAAGDVSEGSGDERPSIASHEEGLTCTPTRGGREEGGGGGWYAEQREGRGAYDITEHFVLLPPLLSPLLGVYKINGGHEYSNTHNCTVTCPVYNHA